MSASTAGDASAAWRAISERVRTYLPPADFELWFAGLRGHSRVADRLYVTGPERACTWVARRYGRLVETAAREANLPGLSVSFVSGVPDPAPAAVAGRSRGSAEPAVPDGYRFERFVIGEANRIAHGAALAVAEAPGEAYNPLFLYGPPGLGKTHLLGAIANYVSERNPEMKIVYTTAERFTTEFVGSIAGKSTERFKARHRGADLLLIDDVQFLEAKPATADELFHTFNALHEAGAQIVLSADRMPAELSTLAERLRDRFEWGLIVELAPADERTRLAYLRRLAGERGDLLDEGALAAIATRCEHNLRGLQGALTRVLAHASLGGSRISAELVERAIPSAASPTGKRSPSLNEIAAAVSERLGVDRDQLFSASRVGPVTAARQLAMYLARELTDMSLPAIATAFNRRDHTTVIHAVRRVEERLRQNASMGATVSELVTELSGVRDRTD